MKLNHFELDPNGHFVTANGINVFYRDQGIGKPLMLLHGGTDTHRRWNPHLPTFLEHFRVITPDSRGHGRTINPSKELSYRMMADDLAALIQALELDHPLIFGYSDGGQAVLDFGMRYPGFAKALIIGAAWYRFSKEYQHALRKAGFVGPGEINYQVFEKNAPPDWMERMRHSHPHPDPDYPRVLLETLASLWWTPLDYRAEDFKRITDPALILIGELDEMIPLAEAREMAEMIPRAELAVIPSAAHNDVLIENGLFLNLVLDFLTTQSD
jgi:pimeloyl-ACP methyl ester carboxylesterase